MGLVNSIQSWLLPTRPVVGVPILSLPKGNDTWLTHHLYIQLNDYCCGVAAAATVVETLTGEVDVPKLVDRIGPTEKWGTSDTKLAKGLRQFGLRASSRAHVSDFSWVCESLRQSRIPLFTVKTSQDSVRHWVAVIGFNHANRELLVADSCRPHDARRPWAAFRRTAMDGQTLPALVCRR